MMRASENLIFIKNNCLSSLNYPKCEISLCQMIRAESPEGNSRAGKALSPLSCDEMRRRLKLKITVSANPLYIVI